MERLLKTLIDHESRLLVCAGTGKLQPRMRKAEPMAMMINLSVLVRADWDDDAAVWVATSDDVPGLVAEHADFRRLQEMVLELVPILLVENDMVPAHDMAFDVPVHMTAQAVSRGHARIAA